MGVKQVLEKVVEDDKNRHGLKSASTDTKKLIVAAMIDLGGIQKIKDAVAKETRQVDANGGSTISKSHFLVAGMSLTIGWALSFYYHTRN